MKKALRKFGALTAATVAAVGLVTLAPRQLGEDTSGSPVTAAYEVPAIWRFANFDYAMSGTLNPPPMAIPQEGQDIASVKFTLTNRKTGDVVLTTTDTAEPFCITSNCGPWDTSIYPNGYYTLQAMATRQDGSKSGRIPVIYLYNSTVIDPQVDPNPATIFDIVHMSSTVTGTVDPGPAAVTRAGFTVTEYLFELKNNSGAVVKSQVERTGPYCLSGTSNATNTDCGPFDSSLYANGNYTLSVTATLSNGSTQTQNYSFAINNTAPSGSEPSTYNLYVDAAYVGTESGTQAQPFNTITEAVNAAVAGNKIWVRAGTYRETVLPNKANLTFSGASGAIIKGSDVLTGWVVTGTNWTKSYTVNAQYTGTPCDDGTSLCQLPEQVFINGTEQVQVTTLGAATAGKFYADRTAGVIYLGTDPTGKTVEVSQRAFWVKGVSGQAANVTFEGFTMLHAAQSAQRGSFKDNNNNGWIVRNNDFSYGGGLQITGDNATVNNNAIHHNIQNGIATGNAGDDNASCTDETSANCRNTGQTWQFNTVYNNNINGFNPGSEGGGSKFSRAYNLIVSNNVFHDNSGYGIWCDVSCNNVTIDNNDSYFNTRAGISYEISTGCTITNNDVWNNGSNFPDWAFGAGILIQNSSNCTVSNNYLAWNYDGITVVQQNRGTFTAVHDNYIHHNTVAQDEKGNQPKIYAWARDSSATSNMYDSGQNNRGEYNSFYRTGNPVYEWTTTTTSVATYNGTPGCQGTCLELTSGAMSSTLTSRGIPTTP